MKKNYTYLVKSGNYYKVGFTNNIHRRINEYKTHNPQIEFIGFIFTYTKSGRNLETQLHREIEKKYNTFEWFYSDSIITFDSFKASKNRQHYYF